MHHLELPNNDLFAFSLPSALRAVCDTDPGDIAVDPPSIRFVNLGILSLRDKEKRRIRRLRDTPDVRGGGGVIGYEVMSIDQRISCNQT